MAYNKSKHLDAAQKYLQQGKLPQAIAEYQQILKNEPKDQVTLMTLGDLFVRQGETFQALEYFERLAKDFSGRTAFTTKAIAIYKKVAKLAPEETRLWSDWRNSTFSRACSARRAAVSAACRGAFEGRTPTASRGTLAEAAGGGTGKPACPYETGRTAIAMGQQKEAIETFFIAIQRVHEHGDHAEAIRLAERLLKIDAQHLPTLTLKARALMGAGKRAEASTLWNHFLIKTPAARLRRFC